jgi:hypothetical protein
MKQNLHLPTNKKETEEQIIAQLNDAENLI